MILNLSINFHENSKQIKNILNIKNYYIYLYGDNSYIITILYPHRKINYSGLYLINNNHLFFKDSLIQNKMDNVITNNYIYNPKTLLFNSINENFESLKIEK